MPDFTPFGSLGFDCGSECLNGTVIVTFESVAGCRRIASSCLISSTPIARGKWTLKSLCRALR